jgi:diguanylate cyclase (GGDEF)-like protein
LASVQVASPELAPATIANIDTDPLLRALNDFLPAVRARMQSDGRAATTSFLRARAELNSGVARYASQRQVAPDDDLRIGIRQLVEVSDKLVALADRRRGVWTAYSTHFNAMNDRVKHSLEGAFKLFGRVFARESLIAVSNQLDDLRRNFSVLATSQKDDQHHIDSLLASEHALMLTLQNNRKRFLRSDGQEWVDAMDQDLAAIGELPAAVTQIKGQWEHAEATFNRLESDVRQLLTLQQPRATATNDNHTTPETRQVIGMAPRDNQVALPTENKPLAAAAVEDKRSIAAWVSGATVLLVLLICIRTVRGIATPVRQLLAGVDLISTGHTPRSLRTGSITELNQLVIAFNSMSNELTAARQKTKDHQDELEMKVRERTQQLEALAGHDPLTSLPNRRQLFELLEADLRKATLGEHLVGIFFLDIDNFKNINDSMDHTFGDRVLKEVANRLRAAIGVEGFAARLGGDEFTFVLSRAKEHHEVIAFGEQVMQAFNRGFNIDQREVMVSISIGASVYPAHGSAPEVLLKAADSAVYRAKALGRNQLLMFTPDLLELASHRFDIEQGLRRALRDNEFELVFQPEINASTLEVDLIEALIRWRREDGRLATPGEFLAIAEESGLIMDISDWVLRTAIATAAHWHHGSWPAARVAINVSPRQLMDIGFVDRVDALLREYHLPATCIEIELTENVLQTGPATLNALLRLRELGIAIALDDFGSGYSTLASLQQLPLTRVKLDRSLIATIDTNERSLAIARAIIGLCHGLGIQITAEGIERPEQFALLAIYRSMHLQGYLFAKPLPQREVLSSLQTVSQLAQLQLLTMPQHVQHSNVIELTPPTSRISLESHHGNSSAPIVI